MSKFNSKELYKEIKKGSRIYKEDSHCPMILDVMNKEGTMTAFCKRALISDALFYKWCREFPIFKECYLIGKMISKANWEEEGINGKQDENFNLELWRITGACRYGIGRTNRIRLDIKEESNPYEQYKSIMQQASGEEFSASELKQVMESINVGIRAFETHELQNEINRLNEEMKRMEHNDANNKGATVPIAKEN